MSVQVKLTAVKELSNSSSASIVEISNFNFTDLTSAIKEFLTSINYEQGTSSVTVDISNISSDLVTIRQGLSVYGTQLNTGQDPTVINLSPSGAVTAKNFFAEDVTESLRLRLRVFGALPTTGIPGEIVYINQQGTRAEGVYVWLNSTGWTLLSGGGAGGGSVCMQEIVIDAPADAVISDQTNISSSGIFLIPAPRAASAFVLFVNGQQVPMGNGTKLAPAYFSKDGGSTASNWSQVDAQDLVYFNPSQAGYPLETTDHISLHYLTDDPTCSQAGFLISTQTVTGNTTNFSQYGITIYGTPANPGAITVAGLQLPPFNPHQNTLPSGYALSNTELGFQISDPLGVFANGAIVKFTLPQSITLADFNQVRIFHEVNSTLVDETVMPGDLPGDLYVPNYAARTICAQVTSFSPFYAIRGVGVTTTTTAGPTTTTTTATPGPTTTTTTTCAPNGIQFYTNYGTNPSRATFYGTPTGPYSVAFTDINGRSHDLTGLSGSNISLGWTFDVNSIYYTSIPGVVGTYTFTLSGGCQYTVQIPVQTTTTSTSTTTTTTVLGQTTTTTTSAPTTSTTSTTSSTTSTTTLAYYSVKLVNTTPYQIRVNYPSGQAPTNISNVRVPGIPAGGYAIVCATQPVFSIPEGIEIESATENCPGGPYIPTTTTTTGPPTTSTTTVPTTSTTTSTSTTTTHAPTTTTTTTHRPIPTTSTTTTSTSTTSTSTTSTTSTTTTTTSSPGASTTSTTSSTTSTTSSTTEPPITTEPPYFTLRLANYMPASFTYGGKTYNSTDYTIGSKKSESCAVIAYQCAIPMDILYYPGNTGTAQLAVLAGGDPNPTAPFIPYDQLPIYTQSSGLDGSNFGHRDVRLPIPAGGNLGLTISMYMGQSKCPANWQLAWGFDVVRNGSFAAGVGKQWWQTITFGGVGITEPSWVNQGGHIHTFVTANITVVDGDTVTFSIFDPSGSGGSI